MEYEISKISGKEYRLKDVCRVWDQNQQKLYIKHDVYPVDMYTTYDTKLEKDLLIMFFSREESKDLYIKWKNHELK